MMTYSKPVVDDDDDGITTHLIVIDLVMGTMVVTIVMPDRNVSIAS